MLQFTITDPAILIALGTCIAAVIWAVRRPRRPDAKKDRDDDRRLPSHRQRLLPRPGDQD